MGKTHDDDEVEIDLRELYYALKKRVLVILAAVLAGAVIAGAATKLLMTPVYSATSTMLVLTKETTLSSLADLQIGSQLTKDYNILITSRTVLQDVVDELNLDMTYKELMECITIENPSDTRILSITAIDKDPKMAKKIADTLAKTSADFIGDKMEVTPPKVIEEGEVPTIQTSPSTKKNMQLFQKIASQGCAVVMSTHNTALIENYPARAVLFSKGKIREVDLKAELA